MISSVEIRSVVEDIFPNLSGEEKLSLELTLNEIVEGKDIGSFKGDISIFKQRAIDTAAEGPKPVFTRRSLEKDAKKSLNKIVLALEKRMNGLLGKFKAGNISKTKFKDNMKSELRIAYVDVYKLGTRASGLVSVTPGLVTHIGVDEKRWIDKVLREEQKYFNKFLSAIIKGESVSKSRVRIRNYSNAVRSVFEASKVLQLPDNVLIHWVIESRNPCPECRLLFRMSPFTKFTLPTSPKGGSTRCLSYCYCRLRIVKAKPAEIARTTRRNKSAEALLKKLKVSRKHK